MKKKPIRLPKLVVKDQSDKWKVRGPKCIKLETQF